MPTCSGAKVIALRFRATTEKYSVFWGFFPSPPDEVVAPKLISWYQLRDNCSYSEERYNGSSHYTYTVTVAGKLDSLMEISTKRNGAYWQFVPKPGGTGIGK